MKLLLIFNIFLLSLYAEHLDSNLTVTSDENSAQIIDANASTISRDTDKALVTQETNSSVSDINTTENKISLPAPTSELTVVEDKSGLSDDALREVAKKADKEQKEKKVSISDVIEVIDDAGKVDISKLQVKWEDQSPTPVKYDWVQTKSGEWFKGEIKALYDDKMEFDSDEVGLYTFDFDDITQIKSYHIISVNIENLASFPGILRLKDDEISIIQGHNKYDFDKKDVVSFAPDGEKERHFWSGKITLNLDIRSGNTNQYDYSAKANIKRRTSDSRLYLDYLGRISSKNEIETANDHRINEKYDVYLSRKFFWTPIFAELYTDKYKNIAKQITAGIGVGYTLIDSKRLEISFSGGPAAVHTEYESVEVGEEAEQFAPALELSTKLEYEINKITDLTFDYKLTFTDEYSGTYKHHMVATLENELLSWLDFDITGVWDYVANPARAATGEIPLRNDFQLLIGLGIEF